MRQYVVGVHDPIERILTSEGEKSAFLAAIKIRERMEEVPGESIALISGTASSLIATADIIHQWNPSVGLVLRKPFLNGRYVDLCAISSIHYIREQLRYYAALVWVAHTLFARALPSNFGRSADKRSMH